MISQPPMNPFQQYGYQFHPDTDSTDTDLFPLENPEGYQLPSDNVMADPHARNHLPPHAVVIGAGVVGVTTAFELAKRGYQVSVIEKYPNVAAFCSHANAGVMRQREGILIPKFSMRKALKSLLPWYQLKASRSSASSSAPASSSSTRISTDNTFIDPRLFVEWHSYKYAFSSFKLFANKIFFKYFYRFGRGSDGRQWRSEYQEKLDHSFDTFNDYYFSSIKQQVHEYNDIILNLNNANNLNSNRRERDSSASSASVKTKTKAKRMLMNTKFKSNYLKDINVNADFDHSDDNNGDGNDGNDTNALQRIRGILLNNGSVNESGDESDNGNDNNENDIDSHVANSFVGNCGEFTHNLSLHSATQLGIHFRMNCKATDIWVDKGQIIGVTLDHKKLLSASVVIVCGGILTDYLLQNRVHFLNCRHM